MLMGDRGCCAADVPNACQSWGGVSCAYSWLPLQTVQNVCLWGVGPVRALAYSAAATWWATCLSVPSCHLMCPPPLLFFVISGLDACEFLKVISMISS